MLNYDPAAKRFGSYLLDAGLITECQIDVVLRDQQATGMRFGDILVERGWVKRQTIEFFFIKIIKPERELGEALSLQVVKDLLRKKRDLVKFQ